MKKELIDLWIHKKDVKGRINITLFFVNIFLILCHICLMAIYVIVNHKFMIVFNAVSILVYVSMFNYCYKNQIRYVSIAFGEIYIHMILALACFGLNCGFQNWSFAVITASFLPVYNTVDEKNTLVIAFSYSIIVTLTYLILPFFIDGFFLSIYSPFSKDIEMLMFVVNNFMVFFTIIMFAIFYTSKSRRTQFELTRKADFDELTSLYNRRAFRKIVDHISEEASQTNQPFNIAILDIDFFKKVNDNYGHNSGDMILKELAKILKFYSSKNIITARWGGEEFILIAPSSVKYSDFLNALKKLNLKVRKSKFKIENGNEINITISIGSASVDYGIDVDKAVSIADERLYKAKNTGRNKVIG